VSMVNGAVTELLKELDALKIEVREAREKYFVQEDIRRAKIRDEHLKSRLEKLELEPFRTIVEAEFNEQLRKDIVEKKLAEEYHSEEQEAAKLLGSCRGWGAIAWVVTMGVAGGALKILFGAVGADPHAGAILKGLSIPDLAYVVYGVIVLLGCVLYLMLLRKPLLTRRKLHDLSSLAAIRRGLVVVWLPGVLALLAMVAIIVLLHGSGAAPSSWRLLIFVLGDLSAVSIALLMTHVTDYAIVSGRLALRRSGRLAEAIGALGKSATERLRETQEDASGARARAVQELREEHKEVADREALTNNLPDREMTWEALNKLVTAQAERLRALDNEITPWLIGHGTAALLFHPDYLPHMSSAYLQVSQLRALNIVPRRIQLLARRWSPNGLESEYVVVHDVSDIRPSFEASEQKYDEKWRLRSLKKRAIVQVAPNGALLGIAIEEERQFNI
jgi:hypothetical protein